MALASASLYNLRNFSQCEKGAFNQCANIVPVDGYRLNAHAARLITNVYREPRRALARIIWDLNHYGVVRSLSIGNSKENEYRAYNPACNLAAVGNENLVQPAI